MSNHSFSISELVNKCWKLRRGHLCAGSRSGRASVALSGGGDNPRLRTLREVVVAFGNVEHDAPGLCGSQVLGKLPGFLRTAAPIGHAMEHIHHDVSLERRDLMREYLVRMASLRPARLSIAGRSRVATVWSQEM